MPDSLAELQRRQAEALAAGGPARVAKQTAGGRRTARERLTRLLDPGSFLEWDLLVTARSQEGGTPLYGDGVLTGTGTIRGRRVYVFAEDFTVYGGTCAEAAAKKICKVLDAALTMGAPVIGLKDSGGARIQEGVDALAGYAEIFYRNVRLSGVVPQLSVILGPCAGGAVYSPALTDFTCMVAGTSYMFITGPDVVKAVTHETVTADALGGATPHTTQSGVAHFAVQSDDAACALETDLLGYLPQNHLEDPPKVPTSDPSTRTAPALNTLIPPDPQQGYDVRTLLTALLDDGRSLEVAAAFAPNIITTFGRLAGQAIGIVATQPCVLAGCLDSSACTKAARFVRTCDAFNLPILTLVDVPGYLPGTAQEHGGIIRHGAKLLYAYAEATVPKVTLITRKAYGGAYCVLGSKPMRADLVFAYPTAEIAVMGPDGAVSILYRSQLASAPDPAALKAAKLAEYRATHATPYLAAARGYVDAVIEPAQTRPVLIQALASLATKRDPGVPKKHGNIPL
jgi:propionyl-CoA carboxylase beta chain